MIAGHESASDGDIVLGGRNVTTLPAAVKQWLDDSLLAGNFSGGSTGGPGNTSPSENLGPQTSTRLRGLAGASEARNFYNTSIPLDGYNIDRVEVNRGANAILFGTGSPAGIINSSLKRASFSA